MQASAKGSGCVSGMNQKSRASRKIRVRRPPRGRRVARVGDRPSLKAASPRQRASERGVLLGCAGARGRGRRAGGFSRTRRGRRKVAQESRFCRGTGPNPAPERGECFLGCAGAGARQARGRIFQEAARPPKSGPGEPFCLGNWPKICPGEGGVLLGCAGARRRGSLRRSGDLATSARRSTHYIYIMSLMSMAIEGRANRRLGTGKNHIKWM